MTLLVGRDIAPAPFKTVQQICMDHRSSPLSRQHLEAELAQRDARASNQTRSCAWSPGAREHALAIGGRWL